MTTKHTPVIPEHRLNDYKPVKLNPPVFERDLRTSYNPNIAYGYTMQKVEKGWGK